MFSRLNNQLNFRFFHFLRRILHFFLRIFDENFSGFRAKFQKIVTCAAFSSKFAKTNQKFAENSEFCEKKSLLLVNYSLHSLLVPALELLLEHAQVAVRSVAFALRLVDIVEVVHRLVEPGGSVHRDDRYLSR